MHRGKSTTLQVKNKRSCSTYPAIIDALPLPHFFIAVKYGFYMMRIW